MRQLCKRSPTAVVCSKVKISEEMSSGGYESVYRYNGWRHRWLFFSSARNIWGNFFGLSLFFFPSAEKNDSWRNFPAPKVITNRTLSQAEKNCQWRICECANVCSFWNEKAKNALRWCQRHSFQFHVFIFSPAFSNRLNLNAEYPEKIRNVIFSTFSHSAICFHFISYLAPHSRAISFYFRVIRAHRMKGIGAGKKFVFFYCIESAKRVILMEQAV